MWFIQLIKKMCDFNEVARPNFIDLELMIENLISRKGVLKNNKKITLIEENLSFNFNKPKFIKVEESKNLINENVIKNYINMFEKSHDLTENNLEKISVNNKISSEKFQINEKVSQLERERGEESEKKNKIFIENDSNNVSSKLMIKEKNYKYTIHVIYFCNIFFFLILPLKEINRKFIGGILLSNVIWSNSFLILKNKKGDVINFLDEENFSIKKELSFKFNLIKKMILIDLRSNKILLMHSLKKIILFSLKISKKIFEFCHRLEIQEVIFIDEFDYIIISDNSNSILIFELNYPKELKIINESDQIILFKLIKKKTLKLNENTIKSFKYRKNLLFVLDVDGYLSILNLKDLKKNKIN